MAQRQTLIGVGTGFRLIGWRFSRVSGRLREFVARNRLPNHWIDAEEDETAEALLAGMGVGPDEPPVVMLRGGEMLRNPTNEELGKPLGLGSRGTGRASCDLLVVGVGPA